MNRKPEIHFLTFFSSIITTEPFSFHFICSKETTMNNFLMYYYMAN